MVVKIGRSRRGGESYRHGGVDVSSHLISSHVYLIGRSSLSATLRLGEGRGGGGMPGWED